MFSTLLKCLSCTVFKGLSCTLCKCKRYVSENTTGNLILFCLHCTQTDKWKGCFFQSDHEKYIHIMSLPKLIL